MDGGAAVTAKAPAQHDILTDRGRRKVHRCSNEPTGVPRPCHTACEWVITAAADRPGVATGNKAAACSNDVVKHPAADADLQHAAIEEKWRVRFQVEIIPERQLRRGRQDRNERRFQPLVTDSSGIIYPGGIR